MRIASVVLAAALLAGCASGPEPSAQGSTVPDLPSPSPTPKATNPATASPGPSGSVPSAAVTPDLDAAVAALEDVASYRASVGTTDGRTTERWDVVVVNRPIPALAASSDTTAGTTRVVIIGDRAWVAEPRASFREVPLGDARLRAAGADLASVLAPYATGPMIEAMRPTGTEPRNGVDALTYEASGADFVQAGQGVAPDAYVRVWLTPDGQLVALEASGVTAANASAGVEITGIDDPANLIEPPD